MNETTVTLNINDSIAPSSATLGQQIQTPPRLGLSEPDFFNALALDVGHWSLKNFGDQPAHRPLLGIIEELCELSAALGSLERSEILDAIGDTCIYMADYCYRRGWNMADVWALRSAVDPRDSFMSLIRKLSHSHLKGEQNIRGGSEKHDAELMKTFGSVLWLLESLSGMLQGFLPIVVGDVWVRVVKRDWVANPDSAHVVAAQTGSTLKAGFPGGLADEPRDTVPTSAPLVDYEVGDDDENEW